MEVTSSSSLSRTASTVEEVDSYSDRTKTIPEETKRPIQSPAPTPTAYYTSYDTPFIPDSPVASYGSDSYADATQTQPTAPKVPPKRNQPQPKRPEPNAVPNDYNDNSTWSTLEPSVWEGNEALVSGRTASTQKTRGKPQKTQVIKVKLASRKYRVALLIIASITALLIMAGMISLILWMATHKDDKPEKQQTMLKCTNVTVVKDPVFISHQSNDPPPTPNATTPPPPTWRPVPGLMLYLGWSLELEGNPKLPRGEEETGDEMQPVNGTQTPSPLAHNP